MAAKKKPKIVDDPEEVVPVEVLATEIQKISKGMQAIERGPLRRRAIEILLHDMTKVNISTIRVVLNGISALEKEYCK